MDANQEYLRLSGHGELREILGRQVFEWTAEHEKQKNAEAVARCAWDRKIKNLIVDYVDRSGRITPVEVNATARGEGESLRIMSLCRDITERKQGEATLLETNRHLAAATARMNDYLAKPIDPHALAKVLEPCLPRDSKPPIWNEFEGFDMRSCWERFGFCTALDVAQCLSKAD